jgi:hypothetical protein
MHCTLFGQLKANSVFINLFIIKYLNSVMIILMQTCGRWTSQVALDMMQSFRRGRVLKNVIGRENACVRHW